MINKKIVICLSIFIMMCLFTTCFAKTDFTDLSADHWAYYSTVELANSGIINGYEDGSFRPNNNITRAELSKIVVSSLKLPEREDGLQYKDVDTSHWAYSYIRDVYMNYYSINDDSPFFLPSELATRSDMVVAFICSSGLGYMDCDTSILNYFKDSDEIDSTCADCIAIAIKLGLIKGYDDGTIKPEKNVTRAEAAYFIYNARNFYKEYILRNAKHIDGTTVVVSVFANDETTSLDMNSSKDVLLMDTSLDKLKAGTDFITKNVNSYFKNSIFIYDWKQYPELKKEATFKGNIHTLETELDEEPKWIKSNINSKELLEKFHADNIIYILYFNTNSEGEERSHVKYNKNSEVIYLHAKGFDTSIEPHTVSHEILHCFGAPDLYKESDLITKEYVQYLEKINSKDVMFSGVANKHVVADTFSDVDAYYVSLIDSCQTIEKWNLGKNEFYGWD